MDEIQPIRFMERILEASGLLTDTLSVIFSTNFPSDDFHFTQYRQHARPGREMKLDLHIAQLGGGRSLDFGQYRTWDPIFGTVRSTSFSFPVPFTSFTMSEQPKKPLPFVANFAAGAIAGVSEILTFYPLGQNAYAALNTKIARPSWLVPDYCTGGRCRAALQSAANDFWGKTFLDMTGEKKMNQQLSVLTGCSAGATESFVVVPFELVKIRLQDKNSTYAGPMDVIRQIVKKEGVMGMYNGMESTFWRSALVVERRVFRVHLPSEVNAARAEGVKPKYNWTYPSLVLIAREEGLAALYKGFVPKVLRLAPGGGVLLLVVEFTLGVFRQALGPPYI
ncbi:hypothetical protein D9757_008650 [Collybiopsis confluens]|uniref:Uncharacterized protein n=1 Tax=Collybiopsis confluens TaxID=2823264 RepID=A0A8H5H457_9AGAR|nr:hypothetical protein D9757_008650 [Collybiopsis confluens]